MASETAKGIFGRKGAGKTHELVRLCIEKLKQGRRVTICVPTLDVDKVCKYLGDDTVRHRLNVVSYEDIARKDFFPDDQLITRLQSWKRFDPSYKNPDPFTPRNPLPDQHWRWRDSVFWPGDVLIIDEAWRHMRNSDKCPIGLRNALHMARHWRGPADWRNPDDVKKYLSDDWFPGLGGPEYQEINILDSNGKPTGKTEKIYLGGDGTQLVTSNLIISSQRFAGLAKDLREQLDEADLLVGIKTRNIPNLFKRFMSKSEQYVVYTFESEHVPSWREMDRAHKSKDKIWLNKRVYNHDDQIHDLYAYADGYAREDSVDDKADFSSNEEYKKAKRGLWLLFISFILCCFLAYYAYSNFSISPPQELTSGTLSIDNSSPSSQPLVPSISPNSFQPTSSSAHSSVQFPSLFSAKVGDFIAIDNGSNYHVLSKRSFDTGKFYHEVNPLDSTSLSRLPSVLSGLSLRDQGQIRTQSNPNSTAIAGPSYNSTVAAPAGNTADGIVTTVVPSG